MGSPVCTRCVYVVRSITQDIVTLFVIFIRLLKDLPWTLLSTNIYYNIKITKSKALICPELWYLMVSWAWFCDKVEGLRHINLITWSLRSQIFIISLCSILKLYNLKMVWAIMPILSFLNYITPPTLSISTSWSLRSQHQSNYINFNPKIYNESLRDTKF